MIKLLLMTIVCTMNKIKRHFYCELHATLIKLYLKLSMDTEKCITYSTRGTLLKKTQAKLDDMKSLQSMLKRDFLLLKFVILSKL